MANPGEVTPITNPRPGPGADMFYDHLDVLVSADEARYARFLDTSNSILFRGLEQSPFYKAYEELVVMRSGFTTLTPSEETRTFADLRMTSAREGLGRAICSREVGIDELEGITRNTIGVMKKINGTRRLPRKEKNRLYGLTHALNAAADSQMLARIYEVQSNLPPSFWHEADGAALANAGKPYFF